MLIDHLAVRAIQPYLFHGFPALILAVCAAVTGTTLLKIFHLQKKYRFFIYVACCYAIAFILMTFALRFIELGVVYAIWSGLGTVLTTLIGFYYFREPICIKKIFFLLLIILGVIGVYLA